MSKGLVKGKRKLGNAFVLGKNSVPTGLRTLAMHTSWPMFYPQHPMGSRRNP